MKKNKIIGYTFVIGLLVLISVLSFCFIIGPSIKNINDTKKIVVLTDDEVNKLVKEIDDKYSILYMELDNKYKTEYVNLDEKYVEEYKKTDSKYATILEEYESKYNKIESDIKEKYDKLIEETVKQYNLPMTDSRWYENQVKSSSETSKLRTKMYDEISEKTIGKSSEYSTIQKNKYNEIKLIDKEKSDEKNLIDNKKISEKNLLDKTKVNEINKISDNNLKKNTLFIKNIIKIILGIFIIVLYLLLILKTYNKLTKYKNKVKESWSEIDILLKRRYDLLPNYINTVKSYSHHENKTFKEISLARNNYDASNTKHDAIDANKNMSKEVSKLFVLSEAYPELKSNKNFLELQKELKNTEDMIATSRIIYNKDVLKYKNSIETFPSNLIASIFNFNDEEYFDIEDNEKENIKVEK